MGQMMEPFVVAMVPTIHGKVVVDDNFPLYMIKPKDAAGFKAMWDGVPEGMEYVAVDSVMDLRGSFPRAMP